MMFKSIIVINSFNISLKAVIYQSSKNTEIYQALIRKYCVPNNGINNDNLDKVADKYWINISTSDNYILNDKNASVNKNKH